MSKIVFTRKHRKQNKCSFHANEQVMKEQMTKLGADMRATLERDVENAYREVLGRLPGDRQRKRHYRVVTMEEYKPAIHVVFYGKRRICAYTTPMTFSKGVHVFMRWYFKTLK